jgi:putative drug exporter of the RND superfamily
MAAVGLLARSYAFAVVSLRLVIIAGWATAVAAAIVFLPPLNPATGRLSELIPPGSPAAHAESDASRLFGFPLDAAVAVVQRDPRGLPTATQVRAVRQALAADREVAGQLGQLSQAAQAAQAAGAAGAAGAAEALAKADDLSIADLTGPASTGQPSSGPPGGIAGLAGAFPLPNTAGLLAGTAEHSTTIITFLYFQPGTSFGQQTAGANEYARWYLNRPGDHLVGVTGPIPAEYAQSHLGGGPAPTGTVRGRHRRARGLARYHHGRGGPGRELRHAGGDPAGAVPAARDHDGRWGHPGRDRGPLAAGTGPGGVVRPPGHVAG